MLTEMGYEDYRVDLVDEDGDVLESRMETLSDAEVARRLAKGAGGSPASFAEDVDIPDFLAAVMPKAKRAVYTLLPGAFRERNQF